MSADDGKFDLNSPLWRHLWESMLRAHFGKWRDDPLHWIARQMRSEGPPTDLASQKAASRKFTALALEAARSGDAEFFRRYASAIEFCEMLGAVQPNQVPVLFAYEKVWRTQGRHPTVSEIRNEIRDGEEFACTIDDRSIRDIVKRLGLPVSADKTGRPSKVKKLGSWPDDDFLV